MDIHRTPKILYNRLLALDNCEFNKTANNVFANKGISLQVRV